MPESSRLISPRSIITGHANADYDAVAAIVAAHKLYPDAVLILPPLLARHSSHPFIDGLTRTFPFVQAKDCDFSQVELLVLVDGHHPQRFEHIAALLEKPGLVMHAYDHHPDAEGDLPLAVKHITDAGSTTAFLVHLIQEKGLPLSRDEATLLGLGIYEDTGSFSYVSTTVLDYESAAYLLQNGMDLVTIGELVTPDITQEQIHLLDALFRGAVNHNIQGIEVTLTEINLDVYVNDFASVVRTLMDMAKFKVVFALATMRDRIHMIARSDIPAVHVGKVCESFGGGGHAAAASAVVKDMPLSEIKAELLTLLVSFITPKIIVERHMSSPAKTVTGADPIALAEEIMNRYGLKAMPVVRAGTQKCIGILALHTAAKAVGHGLGHLPSSEYMQRSFSTLAPTDTLQKAITLILKQRQRMVPVVVGDVLVGVLTRTDILKLLADKTLEIPEGTPLDQSQRDRNVTTLMYEQLPKEHMTLLQMAGLLGDELGVSVFAVGGFVRDLMLKQTNLDIDLSIEGDGIAFAEALAEQLGGRIRAHKKFKTAIVFYTDSEGIEQHLDVATARLEYYERPAALPRVELSSIKMDLYRRDFTINALAIQLNIQDFGTLIDPFGAQKDMRDKTISVLHSLSFVEDPTRILRAVRFEQRFGFRLNSQTSRLIKNAIALELIDKLSGPRLFNELAHVCEEKNVVSCLRRLENWNILKIINPLLHITPSKDILLANLEEVISWYVMLYKPAELAMWCIYLLALCGNAKHTDVSGLLRRLGFTERAGKEFSSLREQVKRAASTLKRLHRNGQTPSMSEIFAALHPISTEGLLYLMAQDGQPEFGKDVSLYFTRLRDLKTEISGDDLQRLGIMPPSRKYGEVLRQVHAARLDEQVKTREEQLAFAAKLLVRMQDSGQK